MSNFNHYPDPTLNSAIKKAWYRLMPLMFIMYFVAFIDRINVGFAKDAMSADIGLSQSAFALGAGIFFAAYALFGIPANLMMNKLGAKVWLSSTTVVWGLLSAGTGLVSNEYQFVILRFLLGVAEAGFYPGILLLASIYFPNKIRASVIGIFVLGVPAALTLGSPISGALLDMQGFLGQPGWFWMFLLEGLPAVGLGIFAFFYLDDSPATARYLNPEEKQALLTQLSIEQSDTESSSVKAVLLSPKVWHLALIYGTIQVGVYGLNFIFLPPQVRHFAWLYVGIQESLVAAIPWAFSALGVYYIPRYADRKTHRRNPIATLNLVVAAIGLIISAYASPVLAIAALCLCAIGFLAVQPIFWTFPAQILSGKALAAGIGFCTTMGAFFSFLAPIIRVEAESQFNSPPAGLITLALFSLLSATLIFSLKFWPAKATAEVI
ncbi:MFS transporter [Yersinia pestis]|nr:MFS transporter [Yersinia pestis]